MQKLLTCLCLVTLTWLTSDYAYALDITLTVPSTLMPSTTLGIQNALDTIHSSGGGTLTLSGPGSVLVLEPRGLRVNSNTAIRGDTARTPYGMALIGENSPGRSYRNAPLISVSSASNVLVWNLDIEGGTTGRPLSAPAIWIANSSNVEVAHDKIAGARTCGIASKSTSYLTIKYLRLDLNRKSGTEPEGGAGIWCSACQHAQVTNSVIQAIDYFNSGPPAIDPRAGTIPPRNALPITDRRGAAPTMDVISFGGGSNNTIDHNWIQYGNTAGIYLNSGENCDLIWANQIAYFRQHGLDIDQCTDCTIVTNTITTYVERFPISLARSTGGRVEWNSLENGRIWNRVRSSRKSRFLHVTTQKSHFY